MTYLSAGIMLFVIREGRILRIKPFIRLIDCKLCVLVTIKAFYLYIIAIQQKSSGLDISGKM